MLLQGGKDDKDSDEDSDAGEEAAEKNPRKKHRTQGGSVTAMTSYCGDVNWSPAIKAWTIDYHNSRASFFYFRFFGQLWDTRILKAIWIGRRREMET